MQQVVVTAVSKSTVANDKNLKPDDKSHLYWAKGTGFGTGSTAQSWNVEQALSRQRIEEEHVTVLLQVLYLPYVSCLYHFFNCVYFILACSVKYLNHALAELDLLTFSRPTDLHENRLL